MSAGSNYVAPNFGNYRSLINESTTADIDRINDASLKLFFKTAFLKYGFLPVLRRVNEHQVFVTLYYNERINSLWEIGHYLYYFYHDKFPELSYSQCNILKIPINSVIDKEFIKQCHSMKDLQDMIQSGIPDNQYVSVNPDKMEGGETICMSSNSCRHWDQLLDERFLDPEYESENRVKISIGPVEGLEEISSFLEETRSQYISSRINIHVSPGNLIVVAKDWEQGNINHTMAVLWRNIPLVINLKSYGKFGNRHCVYAFYNDKKYHWGFFTHSRGVKEFGDKPKIESGDYCLQIVVGRQSVTLIDCLKIDGALQETKSTDKVFEFFGHFDEKIKNSEGF